ncbi:hypothetical protein DSCOOX_47880 [Desulfosarcina ovata subsp. ovata]|uniref:histidine kinase n=2 Tax=Desulfosarcina ovata TaxID=83564 RepID=A0A5K8AGC5_9BACT|nr:hypothetical protein DSCOOX_47880 [Desulfosarcina ovata subsp. ovata]
MTASASTLIAKPAPSESRFVLGIAPRIALMSWILAMVTLIIFIAVITPQQRKTFIDQLESKATSVALSLQNAAAGAAINEDYASVISSAQTMLEGDPSVDFVIVMKNDGYALVIEQNSWRVDEQADAYWLDRERVTSGKIATVPFFNRRVFHYAKPFGYSGIHWGWIHAGLSLKDYDRNIHSLTKSTLILAAGCMVFSLIISWFYSRHVVRPVLRLRGIVRQIADGDLSVRVDHIKRDELGSLADSVNTMTDALLRRDLILESIRYAAQLFLHSSDWKTAIGLVLTKIGMAAGASRAYVFENQMDDEGRLRAFQRYEWTADGVGSQLNNPELQGLPYADSGFGRWAEIFGANEIVSGIVAKMSDDERALLEPHGVRSLIVIPIFAEGSWWGTIGLNDCNLERIWTDAEKDSLRAGADMLGATIARQRVQEKLMESKETLEQRVRERTRELEIQIAAKEKAMQDLAETQSSLLEVSRAAGMAEVATGVLHNVGNVLNSANVSCTLLTDQLRESRVGNLARVADMISESDGNLAHFFSEDPRGRQIPQYLASLAIALSDEHEVMRRETEAIQGRIGHIKEIVAMQQSYGRVSGVSETISAEQLMEDALKLNAGGLTRHKVSVRRQYDSIPPITVDKHAVLQILLNLINNAKYACTESGEKEKIITLKIRNQHSDRIRIQVEDNGVGISQENMPHIFQHGFTTKKSGHGFGLHSGALSARKLGGNLSASSNGSGCGATFSLELPCRPGENG